jgi:hypothetical protein
LYNRIFLSTFALEKINNKKLKIMRFYKQVWGIIWEFNSISEYLEFCAGRVLAWVLVIGACLFYYFFIYEPTPYEKMIIEDNEPCDEYVLPEYARWSDDGEINYFKDHKE